MKQRGEGHWVCCSPPGCKCTWNWKILKPNLPAVEDSTQKDLHWLQPWSSIEITPLPHCITVNIINKDWKWAGPVWSTEQHKKWEVLTHFLTLVWRQTQCGQKFWKLTAPLPQSPRCSPDVSKVASWVGNAVSRLEQTPQALLEFPHWSAAPHLPSPAALGTDRCASPYWLPAAVHVTPISLPWGARKTKSNQLNPRTRN